ncbi:MAG: exopolysaccharide biosynthesis polyprenyl glycosylphosphotransferase [Syntrophorhabdus sp.]
MLKQKSSQNLIIIWSDLISIYFAIILAYGVRVWFGDMFSIIPLTHGISVYFEKWWFPLAIILVLIYYGSYGIIITVWDELLILFRSLFVSFLIIWVILSLQKESESVSRIVITMIFLFLLVFLPLSRLAMKYILFKSIDWRKPAYLFERRKGERQNELRETLNKEWYSGYKIIGNIDKDSLQVPIDTCFVPIDYTDETTIRALKPNVKNMIVVSVQSGLSFMNTEVKSFLNRNMVLITTNNGLLAKRNMIFKRLFDISLSLIGIILLSPFFIAIPFLIKFDSSGPVLFFHKRCGLNLSNFNMIKYRTMFTNGESIIVDYLKSNPAAAIELKERNKISEDPRITRIGNLLRKTSLDEIPQLFNVVKGEMSIVGPRPDTRSALSEFMKEYEPIYNRVKPGITGLWQVSGRSDIKYKDRVNLDYMYVLNWSLWLDFIIILKTVKAILCRKGAY